MINKEKRAQGGRGHVCFMPLVSSQSVADLIAPQIT